MRSPPMKVMSPSLKANGLESRSKEPLTGLRLPVRAGSPTVPVTASFPSHSLSSPRPRI